MNTLNLLRALNISLALASLPPSLILLFVVQRERKIIKPASLGINRILRFLFGLMAFISITNALMTISAFFSLHSSLEPNVVREILNLRSIIGNLGFTVVSWGFLILHRRANKVQKWKSKKI